MVLGRKDAAGSAVGVTVKIAAAASLYLQALQATGHSPHTLHAVASCLHLFISFTGNVGVGQASQQAVAFLAHRAATVKPNSLCTDFSHIKGLMAFCVSREWIARSPLEGMRCPKQEIVVTMPLSDAEIFGILKVANQWERAMIILLLGSGMRIGELAGLRWSDVSEGVLLLRGKGRKQRTVAPGVTAMRELMRLPRQSAEVFPFSREAIIARLRRLSARSGVSFHPHQFRHSFSHRYLEYGTIEELAEILGHSSLEATMVYVRANRRQRALERMVENNPADTLFSRMVSEAVPSPAAVAEDPLTRITAKIGKFSASAH